MRPPLSMPHQTHCRGRERVREGARDGNPNKEGIGGIEIVEENHMPVLVIHPVLIRHSRDEQDRPTPVKDCHRLVPGATQNFSGRSVTLRDGFQAAWVQVRKLCQFPLRRLLPPSEFVVVGREWGRYCLLPEVIF